MSDTQVHVDYFLKLDGIQGESKKSSHENEIELQSWSFGETNAGTFASGGGGGAGKVSMQDFHFVMLINKASPKLFEACATGKHIASGQLTCRKSGDGAQEFFKVKFTDVLVSSYHTSGSGILPTDQISLNFAKIELEYSEQGNDGKLKGAVTAGYDVKRGQKV